MNTVNLEDLINQLPTKFKPSLLREKCKKAGVKVPCPFVLEDYGLRRSNAFILKDTRQINFINGYQAGKTSQKGLK